MLNNREIAIAIWGTAFLAWALSHAKVRDSACDVVKAALHPKIGIPVLLLVAYLVACLYGLRGVGFWTPDLLKETVVWFAFTGVILPFRFITTDAETGFFAKFAEDDLKVFVLVQFIVNLYSFALPIELILVPTIALIGMMRTLAEYDRQYTAVAKLMRTLEAIIGLGIVAFAFQQAVSDPDIASAANIRAFLLPITLSALLAPYVYVLLLVVRYEDLVIRVGHAAQADRLTRHYGALLIMWHARFRPRIAWRLFRENAWALLEVRTRDDVRRVLTLDYSPRHS